MGMSILAYALAGTSFLLEAKDLVDTRGGAWLDGAEKLLYTRTGRRVRFAQRVYDGLSYEEIAQQLGKNVPTVRKHLQLARERLKQELLKQADAGGPSGPASNPAAAPRKETSR